MKSSATESENPNEEVPIKYVFSRKADFAFHLAELFFYFLGFSSVIVAFNSYYWHLLNPALLGFDIRSVIGCFIAFIILPLLANIFHAEMQRRQLNYNSVLLKLVLKLVQLFSLAVGSQLEPTVRSVFYSLSISCFLSIIFLDRNKFNQSIFNARINSIGGSLFFLVCIRESFWSLHPLAIPGHSAPLISILSAGCLSAVYIYYTEIKVLSLNSVSVSSNLSSWKEFCGAWIIGSSIFLMALLYSSDVLPFRWYSQDPVVYGPVFCICLGFGWIISLIGVCPKLNPKALLITRSLFLFGYTLFQILFLFVNCSYAMALFFPFILAFGFYLLAQNSCYKQKKFLIYVTPLIIGLQLVYGFINQIAWFAGSMVPLIGTLMWSNKAAVMLVAVIPCVLATAAGIWMEYITPDNLTDINVDQPAMDEESGPAVMSTIYKDKKFIKKLFEILKHPFLIFFLIIILIYLPALRTRVYHYKQRGSRYMSVLTDDVFTFGTYNVQVGHTLFPQAGGGGFPNQDLILQDDERMEPDVWGLQESDTANLLHMNSDLVGYLADRHKLYPFYGPSSAAATPGVSFLSQKELVDTQVVLLPRFDEPLNRYLILGTFVASTPSQVVKICVGTLHLSAFSAAAREGQLVAVKDAIRKYCSDEMPFVLMGDFNADEELISRHLSDVGLISAKTFGHTETSEYKSLDHIYYRKLRLYKSRIATTAGFSDHLPVIASFFL